MNLNREIAFLEDQLKYGLDSRGKKLTKEQKEALESRLKAAMDQKMAIESQYDSVSKTAAENSKTETLSIRDVEGNEAAVESKQVSEEDTKEQQQEVPEAENSDPVKQEGEQLSLFNEKDFGEQTEERLLRKKLLSREAPTEGNFDEEAPSEEAPATEEEAPSQDDIYGTDNEVRYRQRIRSCGQRKSWGWG